MVCGGRRVERAHTSAPPRPAPCALPRAGKKKIVDPFSKKDWYDIKAPSAFNVRNVGKTLVTRTQGTKVRGVGGRARAGRACARAWV